MFEQAFRNIDDILRKEAGCTTELDYTEQTSWLLFMKYLDELEHRREIEAKLEGKRYSFILDKDYRWENWAAGGRAPVRVWGATTSPPVKQFSVHRSDYYGLDIKSEKTLSPTLCV